MSNNHTRPVLLSLAAFALLAAVHTWPMPSAPRHWSRVEGDGALNVWAAGWVGHALVHAPSRLFDANIFYPEKRTLAFSEAMLVQGAMAAPIMAFDGDAVLAYNVSSFIGFVLTGWAFCLLVWRWTGSWSAGLRRRFARGVQRVHAGPPDAPAVSSRRVHRGDAVRRSIG